MQEILNIRNVNNSQFEALCQAYKLLVSHWNTITNIVSTRNVDNLLTDLVRQSVKPLEFLDLPPHARIMDVGSGAGIPALPLKFARQDLQLTLLEPQRKKWLFLQRAVAELKLNQVTVIRERIEQFALQEGIPGAFDLITTRGVGSAVILFALFKPLLRPGGSCWFFKGKSASRELEELKTAFSGSIQLYPLDKNLSLIVVQVGVKE